MKEQKVRVENELMSRHVTFDRDYDLSQPTTNLT